MKQIRKLFFFMILFIVFYFNQAIGKDLLVQNATMIDGTGNPPQENISILIRQGKIIRIGQDIEAEGIRRLDVKGAFVLPGLIDAHVHLMFGPGAILHYPTVPTKETWRITWGRYFPQYLRAYLACGVTTILDMGAPPFVIHDVRQHLSTGNPGPRYLTVGQFISPTRGYPGVLIPKRLPGSTEDSFFPFYYEISNIADLKIKLDLIQSMNTMGIKISCEKGWSPFENLPRHSPEMLEAIKQEATKRKLPLYVHATSEEDMTTAVKLGAHALAHTLVSRENKNLSAQFVAEMAKRNTFQMTTLSTMDASLIYYYPERLNDPLLDLVVPETELITARNSELRRLSHKLLLSSRLPEPLKSEAESLAGGSYLKNIWELSLKNSKQGILHLHESGVPIVMGSDATYFPLALYAFHGPTSLREIELLGESGLSPVEAIKAATITPARMLGMESQIGTIEVGKEADLVVVKNNPLTDLSTFRTIQWTIKGGVAHTPKEWMSQ
ncbi:MAG: hypothetical protein A2Y79_11575 [Deltaproteobacteria bacterium RBG_13_43_22]|nr:MAG: hypothetical protein A2Y79_11575 [Deltaproteobacteria bacterium RBG_13_43_22]